MQTQPPNGHVRTQPPAIPQQRPSGLFKPARRSQAYLKMMLAGPSGSGKTWSALAIASGMGRIAVIDTENRSASLYSDQFHFDVAELNPPYTIKQYISAIDAAVSSKQYDVLIIDSISHAWAGEGGLLQYKEQLDSRDGSNGFANWQVITRYHEQFKSKILTSDIHIICTVRSKQDYFLEEDNRGKRVPVKAGMAPIQRPELEYEFTAVLDLAMDHSAKASKDRTGLFDGQVFTPTIETGRHILSWLQQ